MSGACEGWGGLPDEGHTGTALLRSMPRCGQHGGIGPGLQPGFPTIADAALARAALKDTA